MIMKQNNNSPAAETEPRMRQVQTDRGAVPPKLQILVTIVNRDKAELYTDLLTSFGISMQLTMSAQGTASVEMLHYLGLEDSDKAVLLGTVREDAAEKTLQYLSGKFETIKKGKGVAFTVPMSSVIGAAIYRFLGNIRER